VCWRSQLNGQSIERRRGRYGGRVHKGMKKSFADGMLTLLLSSLW
jgi:hypothetical protein